MVKARKKLVLHQADFAVLGKRKRPKSIQRSSNNLLPVSALAEQADGAAKIKLSDGHSRQIIEFDALPILLWEQKDISLFHAQFKNLLERADFDFQLLVLSRHLQISSLHASMEAVSKRDNEYTKWFNDYLQKWAAGSIEQRPALNVRHFVVVSDSNSKRSGQLETNSNLFLKWLGDLGLAPRIFDVEETRRLIYLCTHPHFADDEIPAILPIAQTPSGIPLPEKIEETITLLNHSGSFIKSFYLSHFPADLNFGWFRSLIKPVSPFSFSVHFHACPGGRKKISAYSFVQSYRKEDLHFQMSDGFDLAYTYRSADYWQWEAFLSCLPLGYDIASAKNEIDIESAAQLFANVGVGKGDEHGLLLGFNIADRTPVYVNFDKKHCEDSNLLILSSDQKSIAMAAGLIAMRLICEDVRLALWDGLGTMKWLALLLGDDFVFNWDEERNFAPAYAEFVYCSGVPDPKKRAGLLKKFLCDGIDVRTDEFGKPIVFVINEDQNVLASRSLSLVNSLKELPARSSTVISTDAGVLPVIPKLKDVFPRKLLLNCGKKDALSLARMLNLSKPAVETLELFKNSSLGSSCMNGILLRDIVEGVYVLCSPMEYWTVMPGIDSELKDKIDYIKSLHSGINETDSLRQAIYYLGVERETFKK